LGSKGQGKRSSLFRKCKSKVGRRKHFATKISELIDLVSTESIMKITPLALIELGFKNLGKYTNKVQDYIQEKNLRRKKKIQSNNRLLGHI